MFVFIELNMVAPVSVRGFDMLLLYKATNMVIIINNINIVFNINLAVFFIKCSFMKLKIINNTIIKSINVNNSINF